MKRETKEALYSLLDLIDSLGTIEFIKLDLEKVNAIRKEVLNVIDGEQIANSNEILDSNKQDLLGILPSILLDNDKFPTVRHLVAFSERCLNIEVKSYWLRRSKAEIIGIIISEVAKQSPTQRNKFLKKWDSFQNYSKEYKTNSLSDSNNANDDFVETWFKFFDNYKENM